LRYRFKLGWNFVLPHVPLPLSLPEGIRWTALNDSFSDSIFTGNYELAERRFVWNYLKSGMIVIDIGAHHGLYSLLASKKVTPSGHVFAFEPSDRERERLLLHIWKNRAAETITVLANAVGGEVGKVILYAVEGRCTVCNSLRPPRVTEPTRAQTVPQTTLDRFLQETGVSHVDFVKMDVEGAELSVFEGAKQLVSRRPRPVMLVELEDARTAPWGYPAYAIFDFLAENGFTWFSITPNGTLLPRQRSETFACNLVAIPDERKQEASDFMTNCPIEGAE
jgi:FkbM family methyltransferase